MVWLMFLKLFVLFNVLTYSTQWMVDDTGCRIPDGKVGDCISIHSCSTLMDIVLKINTSSLDANSRRYLRRYVCGTDASGLKVCCPRTPIDLSNIISSNSTQNKTHTSFFSRVKAERCRTAAEDDGTCMELQSCGMVSNLISKIKNSFGRQRKDAFAQYNHERIISVPGEWCESAGRGIPKELCTKLTRYLTVINNTESEEIEDALKLYRCGKDAEGPKVCCPEPTEDPAYHPNLKLLPYSECVYNDAVDPNLMWMYGGQFAGLFEFPWMVALKYSVRRYGGEEEDFRCGATLISSRYLLTAAHCIVTRSISLNGARLGDIDLNNSDKIEVRMFASKPQDLEITEEDAIVHPHYNRHSMANDIALIRLRKEIETSASISPICLPIRLKSRSNRFKGKVTVTGWGETESGVRSTKLLKIDVPVIPPQNCTKHYENIMNVTNKQLCAGGKDARDTCRGDSGGPLMSDMSFGFGKNTVLYGVVSFGPRQCAKKDFPAVYTRVTSHLNWILDNMKP